MPKRCKKRGYKTRVDALLALVSTQRSKSNNREEKDVYQCPYCRRWHLTSIGGERW